MKIVNRLVLLMLLSIHGKSWGSEKVLVNIDRVVKEIDEATSCELGDWAQSIEASCKCCLIKRVPLLDKGMKAEEIFKECTAKNRCTLPALDALTREFGIFSFDEATLEKQLRALWNKSLVIKKVPTEGIQFDQYGNFANEASVALFLERTYQEGKLPFEAFKSASCLSVKSLIEAKGTRTAQLFIIESRCGKEKQEFVLKEMLSKYSEAKGLAELYGFKELDTIIWPHTKPGFPSLAIPLALISYGDHYLSLMPKAPGVAVSHFMRQYFQHPTPENREQAEQAYKDVGKALALFHKQFTKPLVGSLLGKGVIHGDFQHHNIFYDPSSRQVTFIDNEAIAKSFKNPQTPLRDIIHLLIVSMSAAGLVPREIRSTLNRSEWLMLVVPAFLKGYLEAYQSDQRIQVLQEIREKFLGDRLYNQAGPEKYPVTALFDEVEKELKEL